MSDRKTTFLLLITGVLFAIYPVLRPYSTETGTAGADAFASPLWIAAHVSAMLGFIALALVVRAMQAGQFAESATWIGVGLLLPYYGAETFALNVLGVRTQETGDVTLVDLAEPIRYGPVQVTMFGLGLVAIAVGVIALAREVATWQAWVFAAGFVLFLPQFFGPPWIRVAHGLLILVGSVALAVKLAQPKARQEISTITGA